MHNEDDENRCVGMAPVSSAVENNNANLLGSNIDTDNDNDGQVGDVVDDEEEEEEEDEDYDDDFAGLPVGTVKILVSISLFVSTAGVCLVVYFYAAFVERKNFHKRFEEDSGKVLTAMTSSIELTLAAMDSFVVSLVSFARSSNQSWPFVVVPDFAVRAKKIRSLSQAVLAAVYPFVTDENREEWETFSGQNSQWVNDALAIQKADDTYKGPIITNFTVWDVIHRNDEYLKPNAGEEGTNATGPYFPMWLSDPVIPRYPPYNWDLTTLINQTSLDAILDRHQVLFGPAFMIVDPHATSLTLNEQITSDYYSDYIDPGEEPLEPLSDINYPIIADATDLLPVHYANYDTTEHDLAGILIVSFYWRDVIREILPSSHNGVVIVFENECSLAFTYQINGPDVIYLGPRDRHDAKYDDLEVSSWLPHHDHSVHSDYYHERRGVPAIDNLCPFNVKIYPSDTMWSDHSTNNPIIYTVASISIFVLASIVFIIYDHVMEIRQQQRADVQSSSHGMSSAQQAADRKNWKGKRRQWCQQPMDVETNGGGNSFHSPTTKCFFPDTTVCFSNIEGFTAWSSVREPVQVFELLEAVYLAFDEIGKKRDVLQVKTIGDCYVAAMDFSGRQHDHAVVMMEFAVDCREAMHQLTRELEINLGPGTGDLQLRIGLHSGSIVTNASYGERSPLFQLLGDTVNTASQMQAHGQPNRIQVSEQTATLIINAGKCDWLTAREDLVDVSGKDRMQTYWVEQKKEGQSKSTGTASSSQPTVARENEAREDAEFLADESSIEASPIADTTNVELSAKTESLVKWNVSLFEKLLQDIILYRRGTVVSGTTEESYCRNVVRLGPAAIDQLHGYISVIAYRYHRSTNTFHDFERASHAAMFANHFVRTRDIGKMLKQDGCLLSGVPGMCNGRYSQQDDDVGYGDRDDDCRDILRGRSKCFLSLSDPLVQFTLVFAAFIQNVDHPGLPNVEVVHEESLIACMCSNRNVTQRNAFHVAWALLMQHTYSDLQACIYSNEMELQRFRKLLENFMQASNIFDQELEASRVLRLKEVLRNTSDHNNFYTSNDNQRNNNNENTDDFENRLDENLTTVLEYVVQASDVVYAMQQWNVYLKWSHRRFLEQMQHSLNNGNINIDFVGSGSSLCARWYANELTLFDMQIIPLSHKLKDCCPFLGTVTCDGFDDFIDFACNNRNEFEHRGRFIVQQWFNGLLENQQLHQ